MSLDYYKPHDDGTYGQDHLTFEQFLHYWLRRGERTGDTVKVHMDMDRTAIVEYYLHPDNIPDPVEDMFRAEVLNEEMVGLLRALTATVPVASDHIGDVYCIYCDYDEYRKPQAHASNCPWLRAVEYLAQQGKGVGDD